MILRGGSRRGQEAGRDVDHIDGRGVVLLVTSCAGRNRTTYLQVMKFIRRKRAGVERGGHAGSTWSCVTRLQERRSACPPACCITPSASRAIGTSARPTSRVRRSSPSARSPTATTARHVGPPTWCR